MRSTIMMAAVASALAFPAWAGDTAAPDGAKVYFLSPADGESVQSPVTVVFGLSGMGVAPAGTDNGNTGHHHLLIDRPAFGDGPDDAEMANSGLFADENHIHFGGGQTETTVELAPGEHTLQLVLGDMNHVPHDPPVTSDWITITVTE